jgi:hypothetical protein
MLHAYHFKVMQLSVQESKWRSDDNYMILLDRLRRRLISYYLKEHDFTHRQSNRVKACLLPVTEAQGFPSHRLRSGEQVMQATVGSDGLLSTSLSLFPHWALLRFFCCLIIGLEHPLHPQRDH